MNEQYLGVLYIIYCTMVGIDDLEICKGDTREVGMHEYIPRCDDFSRKIVCWVRENFYFTVYEVSVRLMCIYVLVKIIV